MGASQGLTNLQLELLKVFSIDLEEEQLQEIKNILTNYFSEKATKEMDRLWEERGWSNETMHEWSKEHLRKK